MAREAIRQSHPDLADLTEELIPFATEFLSALVTVVDDDDLKEWGQYSELTLQQRFESSREQANKANAPLDLEIAEWQNKIRQKAATKIE